MIRMILIGTGVVYGSVYGALLALILTAWAARTIARKIRKRRADRAWDAAWRQHVLDVRAGLRDREGLIGAGFEEWAHELYHEEPAS